MTTIRRIALAMIVIVSTLILLIQNMNENDEQLMIEYYQMQSKTRKAYLDAYKYDKLGKFYNILVPEVVCPILMRVGTVLDGGKWTCNPFRLPKDSIVYSLGIRNDCSFEMDIYRLSNNRSRIFAFDNNVQNSTTLNELAQINATFSQVFITGINGPSPLQSIMHKNGHTNSVEILKMDIQG